MAEYRSTGRELRKSPKGLIAGLLAVLLAAGGTLGVRRILGNMESLIVEKTESEVDLEVPAIEDESSEDPNAVRYGKVMFSVTRIHRGPLVLVNNDYPIEDIEEGIVSVFEQRNEYLAVRDMEVYLLDEPMLALNQMAKAFYDETGLSDLLVMNGYVTRDTQKKLYESDLQRTGGSSSDLYAMPGCSEFESGYAFELSLMQNGMFVDFTADDAHEWILKHCSEYGFVQRYPEGKEDYTGVSDRPWVFRYVGMPHSWYMYKNNLCLEEYVEMLESHPFDGEHCTIYDSLHRAYDVYYVSVNPDSMAPEAEAEVPVPVDYTYSLSGNNKHGFYMTVSMGYEDESAAPAEESEAETEAPAEEEADPDFYG